MGMVKHIPTRIATTITHIPTAAQPTLSMVTATTCLWADGCSLVSVEVMTTGKYRIYSINYPEVIIFQPSQNFFDIRQYVEKTSKTRSRFFNPKGSPLGFSEGGPLFFHPPKIFSTFVKMSRKRLKRGQGFSILRVPLMIF